MMQIAKSWFRENQVLVTFLLAQAASVGVAIAYLSAYSARQDARLTTLEVRGSPHLERIDSRLTALESQVRDNTARTDRIVDVMTRELGKKP